MGPLCLSFHLSSASLPLSLSLPLVVSLSSLQLPSISCLEHTKSPPIATRGSGKKQREKRREEARHCCFIFASPTTDRSRRKKKKMFFILLLSHQKQDLGVFVVEAERVEDRVDPGKRSERVRARAGGGKREG